MKKIKLYNVIFPIWFLIFFPPVIFITLIGNFIIDSIVIIVCFFMFKLGSIQNNLKTFYTKNILKVWLFGFLADIIGASMLFLLVSKGELPDALITGISYDPFSHPLAVIIIILAILISAVLIFIFNYKFTFNEQIEDRRLRLKIAITIAVITIPWTFLLPTKWFYHTL